MPISVPISQDEQSSCSRAGSAGAARSLRVGWSVSRDPSSGTPKWQRHRPAPRNSVEMSVDRSPSSVGRVGGPSGEAVHADVDALATALHQPIGVRQECRPGASARWLGCSGWVDTEGEPTVVWANVALPASNDERIRMSGIGHGDHSGVDFPHADQHRGEMAIPVDIKLPGAHLEDSLRRVTFGEIGADR